MATFASIHVAIGFQNWWVHGLVVVIVPFAKYPQLGEWSFSA